jgi:adenine-specific DNA-methyltransferase
MAVKAGRNKNKEHRDAIAKRGDDYRHPKAETPLRPEVGTQAQFKKKKPPATYRYDSSLSPTLHWDGQNPAREQGESAIRSILDLDLSVLEAAETAEEAKKTGRELVARVKAAAEHLKRLGRPFLNWAGKAERLSFEVPTLPLFVHERLSTKAIIETLKAHEKVVPQSDMFKLFGDPKRSVADQVLRAYEYKDEWVNRLILGDSLLVMNSLLHYEDLGGQVQMIYIDPPYGVKFGSNFQPFVRKRDVTHNDDDDMTREPEMVKAYRDTWELGLHSYLSYLRDRLLLARDLLHPSGSIFVQISDENLHHVRELMDEIFGDQNFGAVIPFKKTSALGSGGLDAVNDYLLWYAKEKERQRYQQLYSRVWEDTYSFTWIKEEDGTERRLTQDERDGTRPIRGRLFRTDNLTSQSGGATTKFSFRFDEKDYRPSTSAYWKTNLEGMNALMKAGRLIAVGDTLAYKRFADDFPVRRVTAWWDDTVPSTFAVEKLYVVQTYSKVIERCMLMTTEPGDLVLDPTCGSGTTAYVAEQWGRRWITIDTSRVPLALARQRLLTATFPYYALKDESRGPAGGFVYNRRQNKKGEQVGGIVPHITLKSIANNEPPQEEVLVDRPDTLDNVVRVSGPFAVEATIPSPIDLEGGAADAEATAEVYVSYLERMLEVLRKSPMLHLGGGRTVTLKNVRPPAKSLALSAEAVVDANGNGKKRPSVQTVIDAAHEENTGAFRFSQHPVAIVFGPENGAISEKLVYEAAREAHAKDFTHLYVIGFAIQANARDLIERCEAVVGIPATYVQATPDLMMGELLKATRASQIFSVCGMPDIRLVKLKPEKPGGPPRFQVELRGYDVFDPADMELEHKKGDDIPAWMLDTDYNGLVFHGSQVFFPRTYAWESLKKALKATHEESVWDHLSGTVSAPFEAGEHGQIAVKVIDDRGNELLVVKDLKDPAIA